MFSNLSAILDFLEIFRIKVIMWGEIEGDLKMRTRHGEEHLEKFYSPKGCCGVDPSGFINNTTTSALG